MKYKWFIVINGVEYTVDSSNSWTAIKRCIKAYDEKRPKAKKMSPDIKKTVRIENTTYIDIVAHEPNYVITVRKLGVVTKDGIFK